MTTHIANVLNLDALRHERKQEKVIDEHAIRVVNELFVQLAGIHSSFWNVFKDTEKLNATKKQWMLGLIDAKINSIDQLEYGLKRCRFSGQAFIPTFGQFMEWCIPTAEDLGIPSVRVAYLEACKNSNPAIQSEWSHKVIRHAWKLTGSVFLTTNPESVTFPKFEYNYAITIREWVKGAHIEDIKPPVAIEHDESYKPDKSLAKKSISDLLSMLK